MTLREALGSHLLEEIRSLHGKLDESRGGCVLFENREMVKNAIKDYQR